MNHSFELTAHDIGKKGVRNASICSAGLLLLLIFFSLSETTLFKGNETIGVIFFVCLILLSSKHYFDSKKLLGQKGKFGIHLDSRAFTVEKPGAEPVTLSLNTVEFVEIVRNFNREHSDFGELHIMLTSRQLMHVNIYCSYDEPALIESFKSFDIDVFEVSKRDSTAYSKRLRPTAIFS